MASPNINISGLLRSTKTKGFTMQGAVHELVDNSIDAGAKTINIRFRTDGNELIVADDAAGMDKAAGDTCYCIHNDKAASDKNGLFGVGKSVAEGMLSDLVSLTTTVTRVDGGRLLEVTADWPGSIESGSWNPRAVGASADYAVPLWERAAVTPGHGTIVVINMTRVGFTELTSNIASMCRVLSYTYQDVPGVKIQVWLDGAQQETDKSDTLGWTTAPPQQRNEVSLEAWTKSGEETVVFHTEGTALVRFNRDVPNPMTAARIADYATMVERGYIRTAGLRLRSVYNPVWNPPGEKEEIGYLSFARNLRHLARITNVPPTHGNMDRRRYIATMRHALYYDYHADSLLKTEGNKSNVTSANVDKVLMETVRLLARKWGDSYYKAYGPDDDGNSEADGMPSRATIKEFKRMYANPAWRDAYERLVAENPAN